MFWVFVRMARRPMHTGLQSSAYILPVEFAPHLLSSVCSPDGKDRQLWDRPSLKPLALTLNLCWAWSVKIWLSLTFPTNGFSMVGVGRNLDSAEKATMTSLFRYIQDLERNVWSRKGGGEESLFSSLGRKHSQRFGSGTFLVKLFKMANSGSYKNMTNWCPKMQCSGGLDHSTA